MTRPRPLAIRDHSKQMPEILVAAILATTHGGDEMLHAEPFAVVPVDTSRQRIARALPDKAP